MTSPKQNNQSVTKHFCKKCKKHVKLGLHAHYYLIHDEVYNENN